MLRELPFRGMLIFMVENIGVTKNSNENTPSIIRRFTKRVQGSGIVRHVRGTRYYKRPESKFTKKKGALKLLERRERYEHLSKLGKLPDKKKRGGRRR